MYVKDMLWLPHRHILYCPPPLIGIIGLIFGVGIGKQTVRPYGNVRYRAVRYDRTIRYRNRTVPFVTVPFYFWYGTIPYRYRTVPICMSILKRWHLLTLIFLNKNSNYCFRISPGFMSGFGKSSWAVLAKAEEKVRFDELFMNSL